MADLTPVQVEEARDHFEIYDFNGEGKIDAVNLGDCIRSLNLRPTEQLIESLGGTKKPGEKKMTFEEFLPAYSQAKKDKDFGTLADFLEGFKVYDKLENGTMLMAELAHVLVSLGERMTDDTIEDVLKSHAGEEDEDGYIHYEPFLKGVLNGPYPAPPEEK
ncbi:myosin light chain alkali-like [Centruroides sculpturatus]|uniref:myosin light chain alkali-like n=1 Tax=Centruroides sculpturatus TaxID=218467 RepID=UPI000C6D6937|nr:myosin light chain alkali-like [Centruroides sculpturatus]